MGIKLGRFVVAVFIMLGDPEGSLEGDFVGVAIGFVVGNPVMGLAVGVTVTSEVSNSDDIAFVHAQSLLNLGLKNNKYVTPPAAYNNNAKVNILNVTMQYTFVDGCFVSVITPCNIAVVDPDCTRRNEALVDCADGLTLFGAFC